MSSPRIQAGLRTATAAAVALALVMTAHSLATLDHARRQWRRKLADRGELVRLTGECARQQAVVRRCAERNWGAPAALAEVARDSTGGAGWEVRETEPVASLPEWTVRRASAQASGVAYVHVGRLLQAAATQEPPWTLAACSIRASAQADRATRVELTFECPVRRPAP